MRPVGPSLVDTLYAALRERILSGDIAGGTALTELDVAAAYSVARSTAKPAIERLIHEGLLSRASYRSARVPVLSAADARDLYLCRTFLEREVMLTLAARRYVPPEARGLVAALRAATANPSVSTVVAIDVGFHRALLDAVGSPRLNRLYNSLMGEAHLCMAQVQANHLVRPEVIAVEHEAILDAIASGAKRRAADEVSDHLARACRRLLEHIEADAMPDAAAEVARITVQRRGGLRS